MSHSAIEHRNKPVKLSESEIQSIMVSVEAAKARRDFIAMLDGYERLGQHVGLFTDDPPEDSLERVIHK